LKRKNAKQMKLRLRDLEFRRKHVKQQKQKP